MATDTTAGGGLPRPRLLALDVVAVAVAAVVVGLAVLATGGTDTAAPKAAPQRTTSKPLPGRPAIAAPPVAGAPDRAADRVAWATTRLARDPSADAALVLAAAQVAADDAPGARTTLAAQPGPRTEAALALLDYDAKDPAPAIARLRALAAASPGDGFIGFSLGEALLWSGQRAAGEQALRAVRDAAPDTFYGVSADDLIHPATPSGYPPYVPTAAPPARSLAQVRAAAAAHADELQPQLDYGAALLAAGQRTAAVDAFASALAVDPGSVEAKVGKIIATYAKDNPAASFGQMGPLVRDNPGNVSPRLHLALMLLWLRDTDTARAELRQVAAQDPNGRLGQVAQQLLASQ
ncbi:MAG: tetratricopeptide repeat protein [Gaiellales bacterium]